MINGINIVFEIRQSLNLQFLGQDITSSFDNHLTPLQTGIELVVQNVRSSFVSPDSWGRVAVLAGFTIPKFKRRGTSACALKLRARDITSQHSGHLGNEFHLDLMIWIRTKLFFKTKKTAPFLMEMIIDGQSPQERLTTLIVHVSKIKYNYIAICKSTFFKRLCLFSGNCVQYD